MSEQERISVELTRTQVDFLLRAGSKLVAPITSSTPPDWIRAMAILRCTQESLSNQPSDAASQTIGGPDSRWASHALGSHKMPLSVLVDDDGFTDLLIPGIPHPVRIEPGTRFDLMWEMGFSVPRWSLEEDGDVG